MLDVAAGGHHPREGVKRTAEQGKEAWSASSKTVGGQNENEQTINCGSFSFFSSFVLHRLEIHPVVVGSSDVCVGGLVRVGGWVDNYVMTCIYLYRAPVYNLYIE